MLCKGIQNPHLDYGSSKYVDHFSVHLQKDPIWFVSGHVITLNRNTKNVHAHSNSFMFNTKLA